MAKKKAKRIRRMTHRRSKLADRVTDSSYEAIKEASDIYDRSETAYHVNRLIEVLESNYQLSKWEVEHLDRMVNAYTIKYKSPLSKALK